MSAAAKAFSSAIESGTPWSEQTDEELLQSARNGHGQRPFEELVRRYERELFNYLHRYLGDAALAEDAFQATFLQVHLKQDQFDEGRRFRPWLYTIATNQAIDAQRRNRRHRVVSLDQSQAAGSDCGSLVELLVSREPNATTNLEDGEQRTWIREAIEGLPEQFRKCVILVYYQGLKYREAAEVLDIPVGTVKSRLHTALQKLIEMWNESHALDND